MHSIVRTIFHTAKRSDFIKLTLKIGLTLAALWLVCHEMDFVQLHALFQKQRQPLLIVTFILLSLQMILGAIRWRVIILLLSATHTLRFSLGQAIRVSYIGAFFNSCLPGGMVGGDVVRVWITRALHIPLPLSIHSVIIDRMMALIALAIMVLISLPLLGEIAGFDGLLLMPFLLAALALGCWIALRMKQYMERYPHVHIWGQFLYFITNLRSLLSSTGTTLLVLFLAISGHVFFCLAMAYIAKSLDINLSFAGSLVLVPPVVLAATLPISIGGWGVRELAMIAMLGLIGIAQEEALILSLEAGVMGIITGLPGGLLWLLYRRKDKENVTVGAPGS